MIIGIGVDSVEIERFRCWQNYSRKKLIKLFSEQEINYCLKNQTKSAQRFAAYFAVREAAYKALSQIIEPVPFLTLCQYIQIIKNPDNSPVLTINWSNLRLKNSNFTGNKINAFVSITHTKTMATAFIILEVIAFE